MRIKERRQQTVRRKQNENEKLIPVLAKTIQDHCGSTDFLTNLYADIIYDNFLHHTRIRQASLDKEKLQDIATLTNSLIAQLCKLEHETAGDIAVSLNALRGEIPGPQTIENSERDPHFSICYELTILKNATTTLQNRDRYKKKATKRSNTRAASVAAACRIIWAMNEWQTNPEKYGPVPHNELYVMSREPRLSADEIE